MRRNRRWKAWLVGVGVLLVAYVGWALLRPLSLIQPSNKQVNSQFSTPEPSLNWPAVGQSAVGIVGTNILLTHGNQKPAPTASTAKMITALMVLKQKPISLGQQGQTITLTANDAAIYNAYVAEGGSTVPVQAGEIITEYQMLEAMLLPSANNMADSLAIWAYGSLPNYAAAANTYLKQLGLTGTTVGSDASGFNPSTVSTAQDLVKIGELVMQNPVLAGIVGKTSADDIPLAPNAKNVNFLLGSNGVVGVKTGNTDQAGGVFVGAVQTDIVQKPVTIVTALVGSPSLFQSIKDSLPLIQSTQTNFQTDTPIHATDIVGQYKVAWAGSVAARAGHNLTITTWNGSKISYSLKLPAIDSTAQAGQTIAQLTATDPITQTKYSVPINLGAAPGSPSLRWRLTHPIP